MTPSVQEHTAQVRRFFRMHIQHDVDDLVQQTMLAGLEAQQRFRGEAHFGTFLLQIARNLLHQRYRKITRERALLDTVPEASSLAPSPEDVSASMEKDRFELALNDALSQLEPTLRSVVTMVYWDHLTQEEVADRLGLPPGTVASRLRRARQQLRSALGEACPE